MGVDNKLAIDKKKVKGRKTLRFLIIGSMFPFPRMKEERCVCKLMSTYIHIFYFLEAENQKGKCILEIYLIKKDMKCAAIWKSERISKTASGCS